MDSLRDNNPTLEPEWSEIKSRRLCHTTLRLRERYGIHWTPKDCNVVSKICGSWDFRYGEIREGVVRQSPVRVLNAGSNAYGTSQFIMEWRGTHAFLLYEDDSESLVTALPPIRLERFCTHLSMSKRVV